MAQARRALPALGTWQLLCPGSRSRGWRWKARAGPSPAEGCGHCAHGLGGDGPEEGFGKVPPSQEVSCPLSHDYLFLFSFFSQRIKSQETNLSPSQGSAAEPGAALPRLAVVGKLVRLGSRNVPDSTSSGLPQEARSPQASGSRQQTGWLLAWPAERG